ncbi:hypothetical protein K457DRAFT_1877166 [Linnemannia elongata AG-77]|uniref:Threonine/Serine exporter ThrE domain-containing protein n=1 Tax=Linnemannia elongata AG-77 TaxID=1314771 RepID=A0A197JUZ5_9FUNG|nr:hypothetical protein K457DRAFT_1877166 [Linnemannia elongata AG-77]
MLGCASASMFRQLRDEGAMAPMSNLIGDNGAQALSNALKTNSTLTTLDLEDNLIGPIGAQALSEALKTNCTLELVGQRSSGAIGLCGNIYQSLTRQLTFQAVVCAVFFLVPGSIGLKGAMAWFTEDMSGGMNFALQMVVTAIAISVGLFTSALAIYLMGKIRSAQMTF